MGHALDEVIQDILIRTKRMQGVPTLWIPGTDHASIATEVKIVEAMAEAVSYTHLQWPRRLRPAAGSQSFRRLKGN